MRRFAPIDLGERMLPGTQNTSLSCSSACLAVSSAPLPSGASVTSVPRLMPLMMRLRLGKFWASGLAPIGCSDTTAPDSAIWAASEACSRGYMTSTALPRNRYRPRAGFERRAMRYAVNSPRQPAHDGHSAVRQVGRYLGGSPLCRRRSACACRRPPPSAHPLPGCFPLCTAPAACRISA